MDKIRITGGKPLVGRVEISGAKNAALPAMAASLLTGDAIQLENIPYVRDILTTRTLLEEMGVEAEVRQDGDSWLVAYKPYQIITVKIQVSVEYPPTLI